MLVLVLDSVLAPKGIEPEDEGRGEDEDELAWQVHGPDARPILEVEAFHEPHPVHGSDARPILEVEALHEPSRASSPLRTIEVVDDFGIVEFSRLFIELNIPFENLNSSA